MTMDVAIVGTGPAGFYTADALIKRLPDCRIDLIDRLPTPFGLIRFGVAPDHQTTKKITRAFDRTARESQCRFFGNVELGRDVSLDELRSLYDAVVLAVGAGNDRAAGIPGEDKKGVLGSATFVNWYNAHPDFRDLEPPLDTKNVVVIGNGNVAIDVARVLVKTNAEMATADLPDHVARAIQSSPITDVYMVGRRGPIEAKFTNVELREMGELTDAAPVVDARQLPDEVGEVEDDRERRLKQKNLATLKEFLAQAPDSKPKRVHFVFYAAPVAILGGERVEAVRFERAKVEGGRAVGTGEFFEIPCGLVISAIGYRSLPVAGLPFDPRQHIVPSSDGFVSDGVYVVGWIKRGPSGVISTNRPDGQAVADHVAANVKPAGKRGREGLASLLAARRVRAVSYDDWLRIEAAEVAAATKPAPRRKFTTVADMLAALN
jgi:ferredoxin--NADP+ reductase